MSQALVRLSLAATLLAACGDPSEPSDEPQGGGAGTGGDAAVESSSNSVPRPEPGSCQLADPAFCETFDKPSPGGRGGDLDERLWSVARVTNGVNPSQGNMFDWPPTTISACGEVTSGVMPGKDMTFCVNPTTNRWQLNDSFDDGGAPALHSIRPRQPIDFSGRTATVAFDLDAKAQTPGGHGWWWELVISEDPSPAPYQDLVSHFLYAKNALVLEFNGFDCTGGDGTQNQLSRVVIEEGYAITKDFIYDDIEEHGCFATAHEVLNHIEVRFSQDDLEVWATDLDDPDSFRIVAKVSGMGLAFSRGYVNLQHSHYNASKGGLDGFTTFHVGSFGFDGPSLALSRSYDVPDAMTPPGNAEADHVNLGYLIQPEGNVETCCDWSSQPALTFEAVDLTDAVGAHLNLNALDFVSGVSILQRWNGGEWRTFAHPYPDDYAGTRTVTIPVEVGDLVSGTNTLEMKTEGSAVSIANIELEVVPE